MGGMDWIDVVMMGARYNSINEYSFDQLVIIMTSR